jgi:hypothetical protein
MKLVIRVFCILGGLLLAIALYKYIQLQVFRSHATRTTATVVGYKTSFTSNGSSKYRYAPVVVFTDTNGAQQTYTSTHKTDTPEFEMKEQVDIYYNSEKVLLAGRESWFTAGLFAGFGAFLLLLALLTVIKIKYL